MRFTRGTGWKVSRGNSRKDIANRWAHLQPLKGRRLFKVTGPNLAELVNRSEYKYVSVRAAQLFDRMWRLIENQIPKKARFNLPVSPFEVMRTEIIGKYQYNKSLEAQETTIIKKIDLGRYLAYVEHQFMKNRYWGTHMQFGCYLLCIHTGLRFSEAATLRWHNIDWNANTIKISRGVSKTMIEQIVFMSPFVRNMMESQKDTVEARFSGSAGYVFPKAEDETRPTMLNCKIFQRVGSLLGYRFSSHANRRTFFCFAIKTCRIDFVSAQKMMNHKTTDSSVAEKHYALLEEYEPDGLAKEFELLSRRLCEERDTYFRAQERTDSYKPTLLASI